MKIEKGLPISLNDQIAHPKLMWPTPTTINRNSRNAIMKIGDPHKNHGAALGLEQVAEIKEGILPKEFSSIEEVPEYYMKFWPTPTGTERSGINPNTGKGAGLSKAVKMWPTPRAGNPGSRKAGTGGKVLAEEVKKSLMWRTPMACDHKNMKYANQQYLSNQVKNCEETGSLNPDWVEWLMGFPTGYTNLTESQELQQE